MGCFLSGEAVPWEEQNDRSILLALEKEKEIVARDQDNNNKKFGFGRKQGRKQGRVPDSSSVKHTSTGHFRI